MQAGELAHHDIRRHVWSMPRPRRVLARSSPATPATVRLLLLLRLAERERLGQEHLAARIELELDVDGLVRLAAGRLDDQLGVARESHDGALFRAEVDLHVARAV